MKCRPYESTLPNALSVWFDMHHYKGMDDPAAGAMIERLRAVLRAAERVGMGLGLITLGNEAFADSPAELRADWRKGQNGYHRTPAGHYHVGLCPSLPGGLETILDCRRQVLQAFADLPIRYAWIWPYDQGGCTCAECAPWGSNGFLRVAEAEARVVKEYFPAAEIVFSTWFFDHFVDGEWDGITAEFSRKRPEWIDWILIDGFGEFPEYPLRHGVPGAYPVLGFPEISMQNMSPWGGFGANPRPRHWQAHWDKVKNVMAGSFPYSEGIFEDMNKISELRRRLPRLEHQDGRDLRAGRTPRVHQCAGRPGGDHGSVRVVTTGQVFACVDSGAKATGSRWRTSL